MKLSTQWKRLGLDPKRDWQTGAKNNRVLLPNGESRSVSAAKAFTLVLNNRTAAGEPAIVGGLRRLVTFAPVAALTPLSFQFQAWQKEVVLALGTPNRTLGGW
jgi:hypothetical protein